MTQTTFGEPVDSTLTAGHAVRDPASGGRTAGGLAFDDQGSGEPVVLLHAGGDEFATAGRLLDWGFRHAG